MIASIRELLAFQNFDKSVFLENISLKQTALNLFESNDYQAMEHQ